MDVAVIEVGMGGRWDATNVVDPDVAVITNVSYDHVEILGPTLIDIATEKAGIIKPGCRVVVGETDPELLERLHGRRRGSAEPARPGCGVSSSTAPRAGWRWADGSSTSVLPAAQYPEVFLALHGAHQGDNAACAVAAAEAFFGAPLAPEVVEHALASVRVPGRIEIVGRSPVIVLDGAHNVAGAQALAASPRVRVRPDR